MKKKYLIATIILIFIISLAVRYYPVFYKGYSWNINVLALMLARNLSVADEYEVANDKNVLLSSSIIKEKRGTTKYGTHFANKLTPFIYSKVFDIFGFKQDIPLYVSLIIYSLTTVLLFLLVLKLFNFKLALIFVGLDICAPFVLTAAVGPGAREWATLFFTIAILIYLWKKKPNSWRLLSSGLFFGLAALAHNAFLLPLIPFVVYDLYSNVLCKYNWKRIKSWIWPAIKRGFIFILPVILLWGGVTAYDYSRGIVSHYLAKGDAGFEGHLFPDPYTYHFEKEEYIQSIEGTSDSKLNEFLVNYGHKISIKNKILMYYDSARYYIVNLGRLFTLGGPLMIFFGGIGALYFLKKKKYLIILFGFWLVIMYLLLVYLKTNNVSHFLEIRFPLILLIAGGIYWLAEHICRFGIRTKFKYILIFCFFAFLLLHFVEIDRWMLHRSYQESNVKEYMDLAEKIKKAPIDREKDVVAIYEHAGDFNYYTDFNYIQFNPKTIRKLLKENKLQWAFNQFGVTKIAGYDGELTEQMLEATDVENLGSNS